ncbi:MAG: hypothetical protein PHQ12_11545 [Chthoniobacteraceae bacterium]|nr:hypothetical protein [Chthoniobacteraceae bacterium]
MIESEFSERPPRAGVRRAALCSAPKSFSLSPLQAHALARLIQSQLDAYAEASGARCPRRRAVPFTGRDLDLLEPLLPRFLALARPARARV